MTIHAGRVLSLIYPQGQWQAYGDTYEDIVFLSEPISKDTFDKAVKDYPALLASEQAKAAADKTAAEAKLTALGFTTDDLKALGLGNN